MLQMYDLPDYVVVSRVSFHVQVQRRRMIGFVAQQKPRLLPTSFGRSENRVPHMCPSFPSKTCSREQRLQSRLWVYRQGSITRKGDSCWQPRTETWRGRMQLTLFMSGETRCLSTSKGMKIWMMDCVRTILICRIREMISYGTGKLGSFDNNRSCGDRDRDGV